MTEYLKKHNITNKELLEKHILELMRNTVVDEVLISKLSVFNSFSAENEGMKPFTWNLGVVNPEKFVILDLDRNSVKEIKTGDSKFTPIIPGAVYKQDDEGKFNLVSKTSKKFKKVYKENNKIFSFLDKPNTEKEQKIINESITQNQDLYNICMAQISELIDKEIDNNAKVEISKQDIESRIKLAEKYKKEMINEYKEKLLGIKPEELLEFKSISEYNIKGRGKVFTVKSQSDKSLLGETVIIDNKKYQVVGQEVIGVLIEGKDTGLLVKEIGEEELKIEEKVNRLVEEEIERQEGKNILEMLTIQAIDKLNSNNSMTYFDEVLNHKNTNSTRHKSKEGESHSDVKSNNCPPDSAGVPVSVWGKYIINKNDKVTRQSCGNNSIIAKGLTSYNENKGIKETANKIDYSEINLGILDLMAERFTANKHKYPKYNSLKPLDKQDLVWALFRHVKKLIKQEETDPETFKDHLSAILCNSSMILDQLELETK